MSDPMKIRSALQGNKTVVRLLVSHEMESGQRKDSSGKIVPAWFVQTITATHNGRTVMSAQWGPSISKNPFFQFSFKGGRVGDEIAVTWIDNHGDHRTDTAKIA